MKINPIVSRVLIVIAFLTVFYRAASVPSVQAAARVVTKTADTNDGACNADCSLREAIAAAAAGDTITFDSSLSGGTINLNSTLTLSKNVTIDGSALPSPIIINGPGYYGSVQVRLFVVNSGVTATLNGLQLLNGKLFYNQGAAIYNNGNLTILNCTVSNNTVLYNYTTYPPPYSYSNGGAIYNAGTLSIVNSTLAGNFATHNGGAIYNVGTLTLTNSTLSGNRAAQSNGGAAGDGASGGAIFNLGTLAVTNSTLSGNDAIYGGALFNAMGSATLTNVILAKSLMLGNPGGSGGPMDCWNYVDYYGHSGPISSIRNLMQYNSGCGTPAVTTDPLLGALANNGGRTQTMALGATSPAIDAGTNSGCPATDQRGLTRPQSTTCDMGAYERDATPILYSFTRQSPPTSPTSADVLVFRVTFNEDTVNVDTSDFAVNGATTAVVSLVTPINAKTYDVTVSGGDLALFNGVVGLNLRGTQNIQDLTGNALPNGEPPTDQTYTLVNTFAPYDIQLSNTSVEEGQLAGTLVGLLTSSDANPGETFTYNLQSGCGGTDNASFQISGNQLQTNAVFNYTTQSSYHICVRTTDSTSLTYETAFIITVTTPKYITGFTIPGQVGGTTINEGARTIALTVPYGTNLTALAPTITYTGDSISPLSGVAQDFTGPVVYTVTGVDGLTKEYAVTISMACGSNITVANAHNSGAGSLRQALADACWDATITFDASLSGGTIPLATQLVINRSVTVNGSALAAQITLDGQYATRIFVVNSGVTAALNSLKIVNGAVPYNWGGGILNDGALTVTNCTLSGNSATYGGGIDNSSPGNLTVNNSTFSNNSAVSAGGGIMNGGTLVVNNSTFSGNSTTLGLPGGSIGGAIHNAMAMLDVTNSTFYGNSSDAGGGISSTSGAGFGGLRTVLTNVTLSGNYATNWGGGIYTQNADLYFYNSIVANSTNGDCYTSGGSPGSANNLVEDGSCSPAYSGDPRLGSLQDNGGPTWTMAPEFGSLAIDHGSVATCAAAPVNNNDQRGFVRPQRTQCDIGAYEDYPREITAFTVSSQVGGTRIDEAAGTIEVGVPLGTDVTALTTSITHNGASVSPLSGTPQNFTNPVIYTVTAGDGTTNTYTVTVTISPREIIAFTIPGQWGSTLINESARAITVTMPLGTDVSALAPTITHTGESVSPASGVAQNFTSPVVYTVTAYVDGTTKEYTAKVTFIDITEKAITAFTLPGQVGNTTIDEGAGLIFVYVPYGMDVTALVPTITHTGAAISPASGVLQNFTGYVAYSVTALNGTTKTYQVYVLNSCAGYIVTNANDSGAGSLRAGIEMACPEATTITFAGDYTILPGSQFMINRNLTIDGTGHAITIDGHNAVRVFYVNSNMTVALNRLTILQGRVASANGGGIYNNSSNLTVSNCTLSGNSAVQDAGLNYGEGGGIYNSWGSLTVWDSTFSGNSAWEGGGIYNNWGTLTVANSTLSANTAHYGGGIFNTGNNPLEVRNSTLSGNLANFDGGGINNSGHLTLLNSTLSGNAANSGGGGGEGGGLYNTSYLAYANTLIANSATGGDCWNTGSISTSTNNLVEDGSVTCWATYSGDPALATLADNGGSTWTMALGADSPAIDTGDPTTCANAPVNALDQRGQARDDLRCDIGAYELKYPDSPTVVRSVSGAIGTTFGPALLGIQRDPGAIDPGIIGVTKSLTWKIKPANTINVYWTITPTVASGFNLTLTLCYTPTESNGLNLSTLRFWRYSANQWYAVPGTPVTSMVGTNTCATITGVTELSVWTLGDSDTPTAVTVQTLTARSDAATPLWLAAVVLFVIGGGTWFTRRGRQGS